MPEETKPLLLDDKRSERNKLGTCAGFCECYKVPHRKGLCTGDNWQPIAATEETKPVEREAFERWARKEFSGTLPFVWDADRSEYECSNHPTVQALWLTWQASADAALERAARLLQEKAQEIHDGDFSAFDAADAIRALKGSR